MNIFNVRRPFIFYCTVLYSVIVAICKWNSLMLGPLRVVMVLARLFQGSETDLLI